MGEHEWSAMWFRDGLWVPIGSPGSRAHAENELADWRRRLWPGARFALASRPVSEWVIER